jgi:hypothetical protein
LRFLRSIAVCVVVWNGAPLLPEHWHHVFGNQNAVVYFFDHECVKNPDTATIFTQTVAKIEEASPEVFLCSSFFIDPVKEGRHAEQGSNPAAIHDVQNGERSPSHSNRGSAVRPGRQASPSDAPSSSSDADGEAVERPRDKLQEISHAAGVRFFPIDSDEDEYALQCLVAARFCPAELSRPLCSLLYQLVESCSATEAHLLDSATLVPLQTTADDSIVLESSLNRLCWVLKNSLGKFARGGRRVTSCSCMLTTGSRSVYLGWASEPLLYVVLVVDNPPGQCIGPALVEKNMEFFSMHFYNVVSNTTTKRQYAPML